MRKNLAWLAVASLLSVACFNAEARTVPAPEEIDVSQASASAIHISAKGYQFDLPASSAKAGTIDFVVHNDSLNEHEFVIVPYEGDRYGMPIGEIEPFGGGETKALRVQLQPGSYRFVCLVISVVNGTPKSDMSRGMNAAFEVTR
ncbi:MAG: hypothetical protein EPO22_13420 [Dehalococcoidia bacterium]|nr:MAG: hypothetical protein EPO22_13420 [Dehalococcoidia bacterium]